MSSDPRYIGPGYWTSWHLKSLKATKKNEKAEVSRCIVLDIVSFPCLKCREHAKDYVRKNPLLDAVNDKKPHSLFEWTVNFHNEVNLRLEKDTYNLEDAMAMWSGDNSFCMENCDQLDEKRKQEEELRKKEMKETIRKEIEDELRAEIKAELEIKDQEKGNLGMAKMMIKKY